MAKHGRKVTSKRVESAASKELRSKRTGAKSTTADGSALSQRERAKKSDSKNTLFM